MELPSLIFLPSGWAEWLNRVSLIIGFMAALYLTPNLLGEPRLHALEKWLAGGTSTIAAVGVATLLVYALVFVFIVPFYLGVVLLVGIAQLLNLGVPGDGSAGGLFLLIFSSSLISAFIVAIRFSDFLVVRVLIPRVARLARDTDRQKRWFILGGWWFLVAFALQMIATF